jgi:hypothetical protein
MLAAQLIMILHVFTTISKSLGDNPTFSFYRSPSLRIQILLHWFNFLLDKIIKVRTIFASYSIKACAADYLFFKSFV